MSEIIQIKSSENLSLGKLKKGAFHRIHIHMPNNAMGTPWKVPVLVAKGDQPGPCLGISAAVHGNELNGMPTIFKLFQNLDLASLKGVLVAVPVMNLPGFLANQREFSDKRDLNRLMPGVEFGNPAQMYNYSFCHKIVKKFDYLLDLHTASFGRINSLYIRADLNNSVCEQMALLQNPQIIVNKYEEEGTLRAWANQIGIPGITIEIGNPGAFQKKLIDSTYQGIVNLMRYLGMVPGKYKISRSNMVICTRSVWVNSPTGGVIDVLPDLTSEVRKGQVLAKVYNVFGSVLEEVRAPWSGVVIGKNINPVCDSGQRLVHLGEVEKNTKGLSGSSAL